MWLKPHPAKQCARSKRFFRSSMLRQMHSLLDVTPYFVIDRIKVSAVRRPQIWRNESGYWLFKKSHSVACPVCRCAVLLKDEEVAWHAAHHGQQLLWQEHVAVIAAINLHYLPPVSTKMRSVRPSFKMLTDTITDWLNIDLVCNLLQLWTLVCHR